MTQDDPVIAIKDLHKAYGSLEVLKGVDITARRGDVVSLIGSSGSGKSTLLRCCNLLEDSQQGEILFKGEPVHWKGSGHDRRPADAKQVLRIRTNLSMVFQQFNLWAHMTILQNVMEAPVTVLGRDRAQVEEAARGYLDKVGIGDKCDAYPAQLSGGQQQRAAIARALTQEAKLILADEPIASLDPTSAERVMTILRSINQQDKVTVIVSLHQIDHAFKHCDRIIALKDGKIIHDGNVEQITKEDIEHLYGVELAAEDDHEIRGAGIKKPGKKAEKRPVYGIGRDPNPQLAAASTLDA